MDEQDQRISDAFWAGYHCGRDADTGGLELLANALWLLFGVGAGFVLSALL